MDSLKKIHHIVGNIRRLLSWNVLVPSLTALWMIALWTLSAESLEKNLWRVGWLVLGMGALIGQRMRKPQDARWERQQPEAHRNISRIIMVFVLGLNFFGVYWWWYHLMPVVRWVEWYRAWSMAGAGCSLISLSTLDGATRQLGTYWVNGIGLQPNQPLMTSGWYAVCRHPVYLGEILWILSANMIVGVPVLAVCWLFVIPVAFKGRIVREERFLSDQFGRQYANYVVEMGSHRIVPRLGAWMKALWHEGPCANEPIV